MEAIAISTIVRALSPVVADLYRNAKGVAQKGLSRWKERDFPEKLASKIDGIARVKTLWRPERDTSLLDFYYPPKLIFDGNIKNKDIECIGDFGGGNIIIQGIVGQGKSILLRYLAITEAGQSDNCRLPVFLELRTLHDKYTLIPAIHRTLSTYDIDINEEVFCHLARSGRMVLLLDAFDELDPSLILTTLNDIECLSRQFPSLQIIVTSRPGGDIQKVSGFRTVEIQPLMSDQYEPFLRRLGVDMIKTFEIANVIKNGAGNLNGLITTPLMLVLLAIVYESDYEIPSSLSEFFERLFNVVFTRHDKLKAGFNRKRYSGLSDRKLQELFESFCFMTIQNFFGRSLSSEQFTNVFKQAIEYSGEAKCDEGEFRRDIIGVACLMLEEGFDSVTFLHKSILEYYAAAFVKNSNNEMSELFYSSDGVLEVQWHQVLEFLSVIDRYRYLKYFLLVQINIAKKFLSNIVDLNCDNEFREFLLGKYSSLLVNYSHFSSGVYFIGGCQMQADVGFLVDRIDSDFLSFIHQAMPHSIAASEIKDVFFGCANYLDAGDKGVNKITVNARVVVDFVGLKKVRNFFEEKLELINRMEIDANAFIAEQDKRKLIFAKRG